MLSLPDDALVVRGGLNLVETLKGGSGVTIDGAGNLQGLSVNSAPGKTVAELFADLPYNQIGVTMVGDVRAVSGEVQPDPSHAISLFGRRHFRSGRTQSAESVGSQPKPGKIEERDNMETLTSIRLNCQHLLDKPRVYADLNAGWRVGDDYIIPLNSHATENDLRQLGHPLTRGLVVDFWTDDGDDAGNPDPLLFQGTIQFDEDTRNWVASAVWNDFHNASDHPAADPAPMNRPIKIDGYAEYKEVRNTSPGKSGAVPARSPKKP